MNERWEYRVTHLGVDETEIENELDKCGAKGWELVSTEIIIRENDYGGMILFFKRRLDS